MNFSDILKGTDSVSSLKKDLTALNNGDTQFQQILNIALSGKIDLPYVGLTTGTDIVIVAHNLGYIPAFLCFYVSGGTFQPVPYWDFGSGGTSLNSIISASADTTNLTLSWDHRASQPANSVAIKYYIFREPVSV